MTLGGKDVNILFSKETIILLQHKRQDGYFSNVLAISRVRQKYKFNKGTIRYEQNKY